MRKLKNYIRYDRIEGDFYEQQAKSFNPVRAWLHTKRYFIIDILVKGNYMSGKKIVDLGCGNCNWNVSLLPVHGVDINENVLKFAYNKGRLASYEVNDFNKTSVKDDYADIVISSEILEHVQDVDSFLEEIKRILKPTGKFILSVPYDTLFSLWKPLFYLQCLLHGYILNDDCYKNRFGHVQHFSPTLLYNILSSKGFIIDNIFHMRRFTIFAVAHKEGKEETKYIYNDLTILIPTLNEGKMLEKLLSFLTSKYLKVKIIICDDGSRDNTRKIINAFPSEDIVFLDRSSEKIHGLTASILDGIKLTRTPYFIVMDGDMEHPPDKIIEIYNVLKLNYDIVIASRIKVKDWKFKRKIISYVATLLGKTGLLLRKKLKFGHDILSGFWGGKLNYINRLIEPNKDRFQKRGYKILFDFLKILPDDAKIGEVYYEFQTRNAGESKIRFSIIISYLKSVFT